MKRQWWCRCGATEDDTSVIRRDLCLFFLLSSAIVVPFDRSTETRTPGIGEAFTVSQLQFPPLLWYIIKDGVCLCRIHKPGSLSLSHSHTHRHTHTDGPWFDQITEMPLRGKKCSFICFCRLFARCCKIQSTAADVRSGHDEWSHYHYVAVTSSNPPGPSHRDGAFQGSCCGCLEELAARFSEQPSLLITPST